MGTLIFATATTPLTASALLSLSPAGVAQTTKPHSPPFSTSSLGHSHAEGHTSKKSKRDNLPLAIDVVNALPTPSPTSDGGSKKAVNPSGGGRTSHPRRGAKEDFGGEGKEFLSQGLYWSAGVSSLPPSVQAKSGSSGPEDKAARQVEQLGWREAENSLILPLPLYYGEKLLEEERAFKLPFDLAPEWVDDIREVSVEVEDEGDKEAMAREKSRKPEPYGHLSRNIYVDRKPDKAENPAICHCVPPKANEDGCGESCINRMMQYSCDPKTCPSGDKCSNKPLALQEGVPEGKNGLRVIWTGDRGFGLKTMVPIKAGQYVSQYLGEIITRDESYRRVLTTYKDSKSYYFLDYDGHEVIDAGQRGNFSRFINHSCGPNVNVVSWRLGHLEEYQMGILAINDIEANTELTYDYGWQDFSALQATTTASGPVSHLELRQACFCGSPQCSGWLGGKKDKKLSGRQVPESSSGGGGSGKYRASGSGKAAAGKSFGGVPGSRFGAGRKVVVVPALRKGLVGKKMKGEGSDSESEGPKGPTMEASCKKCRERKVKCPRNLGACARCLRRGDICVYDDEVRPVEPKPRAERKAAAASEEQLMATSCKMCRERRVKCPRNKGTCDRCAKRRDFCEYDNEPRKLEEMEVEEEEE